MKTLQCRGCGSKELDLILDLGLQPVADALVTEDDFGSAEPKYPLEVAFCRGCTLLQVTETIPLEKIYDRNYPYFSSSSEALLKHAAAIARRMMEELSLGSNSFVVEIASNDGYLLKNFTAAEIPCLGIDPSAGPAAKAVEQGVPTLVRFFNLCVAQALAEEGRLADVIFANNVIAHIDNINDFMAGVAVLLKPTGKAVFECAYAVDMIEACEFDTIYHEHLFYHTLHGLMPLLARHGLFINDVEHLQIHGGSLRIFASRIPWQTKRLDALIENEKQRGVDRPSWYADFGDRVKEVKSALREILLEEKRRGNRIACYGAAAKGATLLNYLDLGPGFFQFVADANPFKHGKWMPGQRVPIRQPGALAAEQPDLVLLLAWNFAGEILRQQAAYRRGGGRFLIPIPYPRVIGPFDKVDEEAYALQPKVKHLSGIAAVPKEYVLGADD
jgi:SAM-dependent methyltransferase